LLSSFFNKSLSEGESEKKADSEPEAKADIINRKNKIIKEMMVPERFIPA
jgi:hypothetical protein